MTTGFLGISYSTNEIRNGKFVDKALESDFLRARYDLLRQPNRSSFNESAWRKNTEEARREFVAMMESSNEMNQFGLEKEETEEELSSETSKIYQYDGGAVDAKDRDMETALISQNVEEIEDGAFKDCNKLKSVVFNDNLKKIGKNAFQNCHKIDSIRLSEVDYIGDEAFLNCTGLIAAELGSNVQHVGMGAFKNCTSLVKATIPPNVTFVGDYAFANCVKLESATVMDGVVEIPAYCFQNDTMLEQVILPMSIEKVGEGAFENCPNAEVYVPTMDMKEAEELLGVKMVAKAEEDDCLFKCDKGFMVKLYKDLY